MAKDRMVLYHRTYRDSMKLVAGFEARRDIFESQGARRGFKFVGNTLVETVLFPKQGQDFDSYATEWESRFSTLVNHGFRVADPIVDKDMLVQGYISWFTTDFVFVPGDFIPQDASDLRMPNLLKKKIRVLVDTARPPNYDHYGSGSTEESVKLITDTHGVAKAFVAEDRYGGGVTADIVQVYDLILIGKLVMSLGRAAVSKLITTLAFRQAANEAGTVGVREVIQGGARLLLEAGQRPVGDIAPREMQRFLEDLIVDRPELGQLTRAKQLTGDALQRQTLDALHNWEHLYSRNVQFVNEGVVQRLTGAPGNVMSLQGDRLMIENQVLRNPRQFFIETAHELSADALGVRGQNITELPYIRDYSVGNALLILESSIQSLTNDLAAIIASY